MNLKPLLLALTLSLTLAGCMVGPDYQQPAMPLPLGFKEGAPRRYFSNKAHALYFIRSAAPTKLVDGSWLFGLLARWDDPDFRPLIQTYLEELGDGVAEKNHVVLYKKCWPLKNIWQVQKKTRVKPKRHCMNEIDLNIRTRQDVQTN